MISTQIFGEKCLVFPGGSISFLNCLKGRYDVWEEERFYINAFGFTTTTTTNERERTKQGCEEVRWRSLLNLENSKVKANFNFNRLAPLYKGNNSDMRDVRTVEKPYFQDIMGAYGGIRRARFETVSKEHRNLFTMKREYFSAHCVGVDLECRRSFARIYEKLFRKRIKQMSHWDRKV